MCLKKYFVLQENIQDLKDEKLGFLQNQKEPLNTTENRKHGRIIDSNKSQLCQTRIIKGGGGEGLLMLPAQFFYH